MPNVKLLEQNPDEHFEKSPCTIPVTVDDGLVVGDVVQWTEPAYSETFDPRTPVPLHRRLVRAKILIDQTYNPQYGKLLYTLRVLESSGDKPLAKGKIIQKTAKVIFYSGDAARQPWPDEDQRNQALADKRERDGQPGF